MSDFSELNFNRKTIQEIVTMDHYTVYLEIKMNGRLFLHMDKPRKWSLSIYKEMLGVLVDIRRALHKRGIEEVSVLIPDDDAKLYKFETMMGFEEILRIIDNDAKLTLILMSQPTETK